MGSKAAIPIRLPEGRERARPPQDEGRSGLGLWPSHGPGEAGSARRASLRPGCGGDTGPASPRPQGFALSAGVSATNKLRSRSDALRPSRTEVGRPRRTHGRGVDGGFWIREAQPPLKLGLLLSQRRGRAPSATGPLPHAVPGQEARVESLHVLPSLGAFPGRLLGAPSSLIAALSSPKKHPFLSPSSALHVS